METPDTPEVAPISHNANLLLDALNVPETATHQKKIVVNPLVSRFASWYEKARNAMDYREEEVILRAAIERILKRRIIFGGDGKKIAEPLIRELIWARYFPDESLSEIIIDQVAKKIDLYLALREGLLKNRILKEGQATEWMYHLMSCDIQYLLHSRKEKELLSNYMYQVIRNNITITDDSEQNRDIQVFIAVRKAFAKDDIAFLRYHLFTQFFDSSVTEKTFSKIIEKFPACYLEIQQQLSYSRKDRIYNYVKSKTGIFLILQDILRTYNGTLTQLYADKEEFTKVVFDMCQNRYNQISKRTRTAVIRSVIFILLTKVFFAFAIEGTFESLVYGGVSWRSIFLNTGIPPLLMVIASFFLQAPKKDNSERILKYIQMILSQDSPKIGNPLIIKKHPDRRPLLNAIFTILWLLTYLLSFGLVIYILTKLHFNPISQGVFVFFLAIVSFLTYRIGLMTREYVVEGKQGAIMPVFDFFFLPIVRVGRQLTEGISQINILLFIFDFIIETPFKGIFGFFEQWFFFLHAKREEL